MRVQLKGINRIRKRLADGTFITYFYAWKGGPRLPGKPGDPEFIAAYNAAVATKVQQPEGTLQAVIDAYQRSPDFARLADRTRHDYIRLIRKIESKLGAFPTAALSDRRARGELRDWRDSIALRSRRQADYTFAVLARILSWGLDRGLVPANPCERPGKVYRASRVESIWTDADIATFYATFPKPLHLPFTLALWTGQRQGDLLALSWNQYDPAAGVLRLKQGKTGARVMVPVSNALRAALDAEPKRATAILTNTRGHPWLASSFQTAWQRALKESPLKGLTFHDLRGTAVTRLGRAGCTVPEIASITGHSLKDVGAILDTHYLAADQSTAESAMLKLERHVSRTENSQPRSQLPNAAQLKKGASH